MKNIPYARQHITDDDVDAVVAVLRSDFLTQGPAIERFEEAVADYCAVKYAVAVASATAGLHITCHALGLGEGDALWTSPNTFAASANCARYCGADVDFVDIDPATFNMSVSRLDDKLASAESPPKVVVPVHLGGQSSDMRAIKARSEKYGFAVIEDAAHAIGATYNGRKIGCCEFSDAAAFSFHPVKIITTGEGGMVLTNRHDLYEKLLRLRTHGITRDPLQMRHEPDGPWYYEQVELGFHYRMTDLGAALGTSQLSRLDENIQRRRELAARYEAQLSDLPVSTQQRSSDALSSHHLFIVRLHLDRIRRSHREVFDAMRAAGVMVNLHYIPAHLHPYYRELGFKPGDFPEAERYAHEAISLPLYYGLTNEEQDRVCATLRGVLS